MAPRSTKEWQGNRPESMPPPSVRQRIFDRTGGNCHLCKLPIKTGESWDADHVIAIINGGENREANMAPAHKHCHLAKTAADVAEKAKVAKVRQKHTGARRPKQSIQSRGFEKAPKPTKLPLPERKRPMFAALGVRGELWPAGKGDTE